MAAYSANVICGAIRWRFCASRVEHHATWIRRLASRHLWPPRDQAFGPRAHRGGSETRLDGLITGRAAIRCDAGRRAVIGGAKDDGFAGTDAVQIEDGAGARETKQRSRLRPAA